MAAGWLTLAMAVRREYVRTLARAIDGRFASLKGLFIALTDASSLPVLRAALDGRVPAPGRVHPGAAGAGPPEDVRALAPELNRLAAHPDEQIRVAALEQLGPHRGRGRRDGAPRPSGRSRATVREAAVRAMVARSRSEDPAASRRAPALRRPAVGPPLSPIWWRTGPERPVLASSIAPTSRPAGNGRRRRWTLAPSWPWPPPGSATTPMRAASWIPFLDDADARVVSTALRSAALLNRVDCADRMIAALSDPATRNAARDALATLGAPAVEPLAAALLDERTDSRIRRTIPGVLARIPAQATVDALFELVLAPETDQLLDFRSLKALGKLRARGDTLEFPADVVLEVAAREAAAARRYARAATTLHSDGAPLDRPGILLAGALDDAWRERREGLFRCFGLLYPAHEVYRTWLAVGSSSRPRRANALEWLEHTLGHPTYRPFAEIIEHPAPPAPRGHHRAVQIGDLTRDGDSWVAQLARGFTERDHPDNRETMELIEKVFLLQRVDLLHGARGANLALIASIAEEVDVPPGTVLIAAGEPTSAMYIVTQGAVTLSGVGEHIRLGPEEAFGTWALIDESPSPIEAVADGQARLLRITRLDLEDLLADHSELAVALLRGLARRMRNLVA
jgi:hypothetical protein